MGANREELVARAHQKHVLVAHAPEHHAARLDRADGYPVPKIRSMCGVGISHGHDGLSIVFRIGWKYLGWVLATRAISCLLIGPC